MICNCFVPEHGTITHSDECKRISSLEAEAWKWKTDLVLLRVVYREEVEAHERTKGNLLDAVETLEAIKRYRYPDEQLWQDNKFGSQTYVPLLNLFAPRRMAALVLERIGLIKK